jgi:hypothetical protein
MSEPARFVALPRSGSITELSLAVKQMHADLEPKVAFLRKDLGESAVARYTAHLVDAIGLLDPKWFDGSISGGAPGGSSPGGSSPGGSSPGGSSPGGSSPGGSSPGGSSPGGSSPGGLFDPNDFTTTFAQQAQLLGQLIGDALVSLRREAAVAQAANLRGITRLEDSASQLAALHPARFDRPADIGVTSPFEDRGRPLAPRQVPD